MRYTYEFKKKAVELYRQGKWIDAPNDIINLKNFHDMIVRWHHLEESNTSDCLKHYGTNKKWSPEEKYELVARVIAGDTITSVAYTVGINSGLLAQWIRKYKIWGYNGLARLFPILVPIDFISRASPSRLLSVFRIISEIICAIRSPAHFHLLVMVLY